MAPRPVSGRGVAVSRINLWAGLVMLAFGLLMLLWQWLRPLEPPTTEEAREV